jgi:hypothetical protein
MAYSADRKPGELTALTTLATDDVFVVGDTSDTSEVAKGITKANLLTDLGTTFEPKKGADDNYVTNAEKVVIGNTSGTNTGDNAVNTLYSGLVTNATHTGEVTGATALTIDKTAITGKTAVTAVGTDYVLISDTNDSGNLKKALVSDLAGSALSDGDKGDITVSGSGATWTIDNGAVTLAKQADMATGSLVYRKTAGSGVPEVQTLATLKTDLGLTGSNSGDQTSIVGISGTMAQFDTAVSDGNIVYQSQALGTPASGTLTNCTGLPVAGITASTSTALGVGSINLGHASDTTIARSGAGAITVEGVQVVLNATSPTLATITTTGNIELGHASDTTISRTGAGAIAVEGVAVPTISSTNTLTNKRVTKRVGTTTSSATPTINTDNVDIYKLTAQTADITSFTTNLSGTPTDGQTLMIQITGTAARAITWGASFEASTVALPTTTVSTARLDVGFIWNTATSKWRCIAAA